MLDKLKNRSDKQQAASRANGARGHGPVTARGKRRSSANALKHGLFARELLIPEQERQGFEHLRQSLAAELKPDTELLWILFDDIISLIWRMKTALCLEQAEIGRQLAAAKEAQTNADAPVPELYNWRQQITCLEQLAGRIKKSETIDENLQAEGKEKLGVKFMDDLLHWRPEPKALILSRLADVMVSNAARSGLNLEGAVRRNRDYLRPPQADAEVEGEGRPPELSEDELQQLKARAQEFAEEVLSQTKEEMTLKLIELKRQHILDLARSASGSTPSQSSRYEFAVRIQESQRRDLLRMLKEYHRIKYGE
jgi:hypothetical protein